MDREEIVGEGLLSVADAARFLGLSRSKLYNAESAFRLIEHVMEYRPGR